MSTPPQTDWEALTALVTTEEERADDRRLRRAVLWIIASIPVIIAIVMVAFIPHA